MCLRKVRYLGVKKLYNRSSVLHYHRHRQNRLNYKTKEVKTPNIAYKGVIIQPLYLLCIKHRVLACW